MLGRVAAQLVASRVVLSSILSALSKKCSVLWDLKQSSIVKINQIFIGTSFRIPDDGQSPEPQ
jgi:hypothetical protein